ncbi:MAG: D-alanyl-D-alanine carboxypeptidase [Clostridia bacterium]|nr:D-alanyl-D-alanine carboxypeptidase [Clostridia bacterium]
MNRNMIRITALVVMFSMLLSLGVSAVTNPPMTQAGAVLLINADTGDILYGKNENQRMFPASTTKIMVALLALEKLELDELVTASASAVSILPPGHTNIGIKSDESLSVRQLLYGLMLASAGDAANVLGERISGSVDEFVKLMNTRALELGMKNTNYMNASGAHSPLHYTTASDMALLAREVMKNEIFREIVKTDVYIIPPTEKYEEERRLLNTNHLVSKKRSSKYFYKYATGIKTGFTNDAKRCLVASAEKNGISLITVVLGADVVDLQMMDFVDTTNLFEYGFANYKNENLVTKGSIVAQAPIKSAKGENRVLLEAGGNVSKLIGIDEALGEITHTDTINKNIKAPVARGEVLGQAEYFVDNVSIGKIDLVATKDYAFDPIKNILGVVASIFTSPWLYLPFVLFFIVLVIIRQYNYNRKRRERAEARRLQKEQEAEKRRAEMKKDIYVREFLDK